MQHGTISPCITPTPHKSRQTIGQASRASQASAELALRRMTSTHVQGTVDGGGGTRQDAKQLSTDVAITRSLSLVLSLSQSLDGQRSSPRRSSVSRQCTQRSECSGKARRQGERKAPAYLAQLLRTHVLWRGDFLVGCRRRTTSHDRDLLLQQ